MTSNDREKPRAAMLVVDADEAEAAARSPQDAPEIDAPPPTARAREDDQPTGRRTSFLTRLFLFAGGVVFAAMVAFSLERLVVEATEIAPWVGWAMRGLVLLLVLALGALILREFAAIGRVRRIGRIRRLAELTHKTKAVKDADAALSALASLYAGRADLGAEPGVGLRLAREQFDALDRLRVYERHVCGPLDAEARDIVRSSARSVATATALAPSILLDALAALYLNLKMIRRVAQLYGGRSGVVGSMRLARRVVEHAMAAGLIALGDDILEPLMGGGVASRISRRLGEGVVNGAMTARIGIAAIEVCRPLPFDALPRPRLREIAWAALRKEATEARDAPT